MSAAHLYHVAMMNHEAGRTTYKDAFVTRTGRLEMGEDTKGFRDYLHQEFFPDSQGGPVLLSVTYHGEQAPAPQTDRGEATP